MSYRGEDLDLRTPQNWGGQSPASAAGALLVDETVLACCNHAYDIALAHRSADVRIEHLIYAMTRIDPAIDALEARGVRLASLRREAAAVVAGEIPVGLPNGKGSPRRSDELAEALRLATGNAGRRNLPASIDDLIFVLLDQRSDLHGAQLLMRHAGRPSLREPVEPLPPLTRYAAEPRYVRQPYDAPRYYVEPPRSYRAELYGSATDAMQNSRIEALEQMVRSLSSDLAGERQVLSGLLKDLSRETQAQRDDQGRLHTGLFDRLQTLEQSLSQARGPAGADGLVQQLQNIETGLELRLQEMSQSWSVLSARLQDLELAVRERASSVGTAGGEGIDLRPLMHRLDVIEEAVLSRDYGSDGNLSARLTALEGEITRALSANADNAKRIEAFFANGARPATSEDGGVAWPAEDFTGVSSAVEKLASDLGERLEAVEKALAAEIETAGVKHQAYANDLGEVHEALMKLNQNQHTLAGSIDQWRTDAAGDVAMISNRLNALDSGGRGGEIASLTGQMQKLNALLVERYHRRNRFWYWLFGTDDWIGAGWPSQARALEAEKARNLTS